jgi:hypothetical protein
MLFAGATEEVLLHPRITSHCPAGTGALLFLGQEGIEGSVPAGGRVTEVNRPVFYGALLFHGKPSFSFRPRRWTYKDSNYTDLSPILATIIIYPQLRCSPAGQSTFLFLQIFYKTIWETPKHDTTKQYNI